MDQNSDQPIPQPPEESAALEALERKAADRAYPKLTLARELAVHLKTYPQSQESLAAKLHIRRPDLTQILGLLSLPEKTQTELEGKALSAWEIKKQLRSRNLKASNGNGTTGTTAGTSGTTAEHDRNMRNNGGTLPEQAEQGLEKTKIIAEHAESSGTMPGKNENNGGTMRNKGLDGKSAGQTRGEPGYPLIRDTIDELLKFMTFWRQELHMGQIVVRWLVYGGRIGWLRTSLRVLATGLAVYGTYQAARQGWDWMRRLEAPGAQVSGPRFGLGAGPLAPGAFKITQCYPVAGHQFLTRWTDLGKGYAYQVLYGYDARSERDLEPLAPRAPALDSPGALVDVIYLKSSVHAYLSVAALDPQGRMAATAPMVEVALNGMNQANSVEPLPAEGLTTANAEAGTRKPEGRRKTAPHPAPSPSRGEGWGEGAPHSALRTPGSALAVPVPTELHYEIKTPDLIILSWRPPGPGYRYNVYSSASRELANLRKENNRPMKSNVVDWTPETGLERYWVVATTLDPQGLESNYSEAIEVIRHPEKTPAGDRGAWGDTAGGILRKVVPW